MTLSACIPHGPVRDTAQQTTVALPHSLAPSGALAPGHFHPPLCAGCRTAVWVGGSDSRSEAARSWSAAASRECHEGAGSPCEPESISAIGAGGPENHEPDPPQTAAVLHPAPGAMLPRAQALAEAHRRARLVGLYEALLATGLLPALAAKRLVTMGERCSRASLDRWRAALALRGIEGLIDGRRQSGRRPSALRLTDREAAVVRARVLGTTNRTSDSGSIPEALRQAARRGELRPELVAEWQERERDGRGVSAALRRQLGVAPAAVRQLRGPTDAGLDFLCAPGSLMWIDDELTGERRFVRAGDVLEADDATVNFYVCVPWEPAGCACSENWGVKVARFQWLVAIDRGSRFVPGWSYTMRPRSSYRAEDVIALFHGLFRQHGVWQRLCLERGVWESNRVEHLIESLGRTRLTAYTPHQKPYIEGLFSLMWTKLGSLAGQVGRHRGEEERVCAIVESCRRGATDPRLHFPMLADVLEALRRVTEERNAQPIHSQQYGTWVPQERWMAQAAEARAARRLRPLPSETAWMFSPEAREWKVSGGLVGGSIQIMEGLSVKFEFAAEWLPGFDGVRVVAHFDPSAPQAEATLVLAENARDLPAGTVLGTAFQVNETASYARQVLGWGVDDRDAGRQMRLRQAAAMRREVRTILPGGQSGLSLTELRDGVGRQISVERPGDGAASPDPLRRRDSRMRVPEAPDIQAPSSGSRRALNPLTPPSPEQWARAGDRDAKILAAIAATDRDD